jgi:hypothetical protein
MVLTIHGGRRTELWIRGATGELRDLMDLTALGALPPELLIAELEQLLDEKSG